MIPGFYRLTFEVEWSTPLGHSSLSDGYLVKGLYCTRKIFAFGEASAKAKAIKSLHQELRNKLGKFENFEKPKISIDVFRQVSIWSFLFSSAPNSGFTFYPPETQ